MKANKQQIYAFLETMTREMSDKDLLMTYLQSTISAQIAIARDHCNLTQNELAEKLGVSQTLVSRWESGDVNFTLSTLVGIALALGLEMRSPFISTETKYAAKYSNVISFQEVQMRAGEAGNYKSCSFAPNDLKEM